ncbi:TPA: fimbrial protein, partial [Klebsiella aerogenes]|nr:fimbrial protein [Klebsiella aerogenes]
DATMLGMSGTAQGAGIVIADQSGQKLDLGTKSAAQTLQEGDNTLQFSAYLKGDAGSTTTVVPGDFQSVANFSLAYE